MKQEEKQRNYEVAEKLFSELNFAAAIIVVAAVYTITGCLLGNVFGVVSPRGIFQNEELSTE